MKRDMDFIREILFQIEDFVPDQMSSSQPPFGLLKISNQSNSNVKILDHLSQLEESGLIQKQSLRHEEDGIVLVTPRLTWEGHDFLEVARDNTRWNQAKKLIKEKGGSLMIDILKPVLIRLALQNVGL